VYLPKRMSVETSDFYSQKQLAQLRECVLDTKHAAASSNLDLMDDFPSNPDFLSIKQQQQLLTSGVVVDKHGEGIKGPKGDEKSGKSAA